MSLGLGPWVGRLTPGEVRNRAFSRVRRGLDPVEVGSFLELAGREIEALVAREAELREALGDAERRAASPVLDEDTVAKALGQEAARVLRAAQEAAAEVVTKAEAEAAEMRESAAAESSRVRADGEDYAEQVRSRVEAEVAALLEAAGEDAESKLDEARSESFELLSGTKVECRTMLREAQEIRSRIIGDLAGRRDDLRSEIDRLLYARARLVDIIEQARLDVEAVGNELTAPDEGLEILGMLGIPSRGALLRAGLAEGEAPDTDEESTSDWPVYRDAGTGPGRGAGEVGATEALGAGGLLEGLTGGAEVDLEGGSASPSNRSVRRGRGGEGGGRGAGTGTGAPAPGGSAGGSPESEHEPAPVGHDGAEEGILSVQPVSPRDEAEEPEADAGAWGRAVGEEAGGEGGEEAPVVPDTGWGGETNIGAGNHAEEEARTGADAPPAAGADSGAGLPGGEEGLPGGEEDVGASEVESPADPSGHRVKAVNELFARLRASSDGEVDSGRRSSAPPADKTVASEGVPGNHGTGGTPPAGAGSRSPAAECRDGEVGPLAAELARQWKRILLDDQNDVLDRLRKEGRWSGTVILPATEHAALYLRPCAAAVEKAARAGARFLASVDPVAAGDQGGSGHGGMPGNGAMPGDRADAASDTSAVGGGGDVMGPGGSRDPGSPSSGSIAARAVKSGRAQLDELASGAASVIAESLRERIEGGDIDLVTEDTTFVAEHAGSAFGEWRGERIERLALDRLNAAFALGEALAGRALARALRWEVAGDGADCPDCGDNALSEPQRNGEKFPTGHLQPPAHPGCRCLLVPVEGV